MDEFKLQQCDNGVQVEFRFNEEIEAKRFLDIVQKEHAESALMSGDRTVAIDLNYDPITAIRGFTWLIILYDGMIKR